MLVTACLATSGGVAAAAQTQTDQAETAQVTGTTEETTPAEPPPVETTPDEPPPDETSPAPDPTDDGGTDEGEQPSDSPTTVPASPEPQSTPSPESSDSHTDDATPTATGTPEAALVKPPVAKDDTAATQSGTRVRIAVTRNDTITDSTGAGLQVVIVTAPTSGTAQVRDDAVDYQPPTGFEGSVTFRYGLQVDEVTVTEADVTVTVLPAPHAAVVAVDDFAVTATGVPVTVEVRYNDVGRDGRLALAQPAAQFGTVTPVTTLGSCEFDCAPTAFVYTPNPGYTGKDSFTYALSSWPGEGDESTVTDTATVHVTVTAPPGEGGDEARAVDDTVLVERRDEVTFSALANDVVPAGWSLELTDRPKAGQVTQNKAGTLTYDPIGTTGTDRFHYRLVPPPPPIVDIAPPTLLRLLSNESRSWPDQVLRQAAAATAVVAAAEPSPEATVTVLVNGPIAVDDDAVTDPSRPVTIPVTDNDTGIDDFCLTWSQAGHGSVKQSGYSDLTYTPEPGFAGRDSFSYQHRDQCEGSGPPAAQAEVTVVVRPPSTRDDRAWTYPGRPVLIDVLRNDPNSRSFGLRPQDPAHGTAEAVGDPLDGRQQLRYTPDPDRTGGTDTFEYRLESVDGKAVGKSATVTVDLRSVDVVADQSYTSAGTTVDIGVTANDTLPEGATIRVVRGPAHGRAFRPEGATGIRYRPDDSFAEVATDTFEYAVRGPDPDGGFDESEQPSEIELGRATVTVTRANAVDDAAVAPFRLDVEVDVLANDRAPDALEVAITQVPAAGTVQVEPAGRGVFKVTPEPGFTGTAEFGYALLAGERAVDTASVTVEVPEPTIAVDDTATTPAGTAVAIDVLGNDLRVSGLHPSVDPGPDRGTATVGADDRITYTPPLGQVGQVTFGYALIPAGRTDPIARAEITVTIEEPVARDDTGRVFAGQATLLDVQLNDSRTAGFTVRAGDPAHGRTTVVADGRIRYQADAGFDGPDLFSYDLLDTDGVPAATATVRIAVTLVDAVNDRRRIPAGGDEVVIRVLRNDQIVDGITVRLLTTPATGTAEVNADGTITYRKDTDFTDRDEFSYALVGLVDGVLVDLDQAAVRIRQPEVTVVTPPPTPPATPTDPATPPDPTTPPVTPDPTSTSPTPHVDGPDVTASEPLVPIVFTGSRCPADDPVQVAVDGKPALRVNADDQGRFTARLPAPERIGRHRIDITCGAATWTSSLDVVRTTMQSATQAPGGAAVAAAALLLFFLLSGLGLNPSGRRPVLDRR